TAPPPEEPAQWYITKVLPSAVVPAEIGNELAPHPAQLRAGSASPRASQHASMISQAGNTVHIVSAAGGRGFTIVPSGATMRTLRNAPSLRGLSGSKKEVRAVYTAE